MLGILINVRLGSTRLPEKQLYKVKDKTLLEWQIDKIKSGFPDDKIIICSSIQPENQKLIDIAQKNGVDIFFGDDGNIPLRHYQCLQKYPLDYIISIDGDDMLASISAAQQVYSKLKNYEKVITSGLPLGMNISVAYHRNVLEEMYPNFKDIKHLDTGWGEFLMKGAEVITYQGDYPQLRFTVDYLEDAKFFEQIINNIDIILSSDRQIIDYALSSGAYLINCGSSDKYWTNFYSSKNYVDLNNTTVQTFD